MNAHRSLPGFSSPAAGFDEPFEMLEACHDRLESSLALLQRLRQHLAVRGSDDDARQAAHHVLRYFTIAAPAHHEDEERHVVPLLRGCGEHASDVAAERLLQEHLQIRSTWLELKTLLEAVASDGTVEPSNFSDVAEKFTRLNEQHLAFENEVVFPRARLLARQSGATALEAMGQEMAKRRRVVSPQT